VVFRFLLSLDTGLNKYVFSSADGVRNTHIHTDRQTTPYCLARASVADPLHETKLELGKHPWLPAVCCPDDNVKHQAKHTAKHFGIQKKYRGRILRESCVTKIWRDVCGQTISIWSEYVAHVSRKIRAPFTPRFARVFVQGFRPIMHTLAKRTASHQCYIQTCLQTVKSRGSHAYMYVCMHACMHVCMYVGMYVCMYVCMWHW
jgi:hypothetical protein